MKRERRICDIFSVREVSYSSESEEFSAPVGMGIELELEGVGNVVFTEEFTTFWEVVGDGSLRNNGQEFRTKSANSGQNLLLAIRILCDTLSSMPDPPSLSHRCSLHTHLDFRPRSVDNVFSFTLLYILLEPIMYTVSNKDRYSNIYCPGMTNVTSLLALFGAYYSSTEYRNLFSLWSKYSGINLMRLRDFGSIEIRTHSGTIQREDMILWVRLLNYMYNYSRRRSPEEIMSLANLSPERLFSEVFPKDILTRVPVDNLVSFWSSSIRNIFYLQLISYIKKEFNQNNTFSNKEILEAL